MSEATLPPFRRIERSHRSPLRCVIDGRTVEALDGDTVLTAILTSTGALRAFEFGDGLRAGFCLMGACQDCWVHDGEGHPVRACTTLLAEGMILHTGIGGATNGGT